MSQVGPSRTKDAGLTSIRAHRLTTTKAKKNATSLFQKARLAYVEQMCQEAKAVIKTVQCEMGGCTIFTIGSYNVVAKHIDGHHQGAKQNAEGTDFDCVCSWLDCDRGFKGLSACTDLTRHVMDVHIQWKIACGVCESGMRLEKFTFLRHKCMQHICFVCKANVGRDKIDDHFLANHAPPVGEDLEKDPPTPLTAIPSSDELPPSPIDGVHAPEQLTDALIPHPMLSMAPEAVDYAPTHAADLPLADRVPDGEFHVAQGHYDALVNSATMDVRIDTAMQANGHLPIEQHVTTPSPPTPVKLLQMEEIFDFAQCELDHPGEDEVDPSTEDVYVFDDMAGYDYTHMCTDDKDQDTYGLFLGVPSTPTGPGFF